MGSPESLEDIMKKLLTIVMCLPVLACLPITTYTVQPEPQTPVKPATVEQKALTWAITICTKFGYDRKTAEFRVCAEHRYDQFLMENK